MNYILSLDSIQKKFGSKIAVNNFNLDVKESEFVTFLGPSGCGKTTTLRMVSGFIKPTEGRILLKERVLSDSSANTFIPPEKRQMGMVFQSYAVWPHMNVYDNVAYPAKIKGSSKSDIAEKVNNALKMVKLTGYEESYPNELSGGQQQRVALARALTMNPQILLLDEPLSNLDAKLRESMRFEIKELQKKINAAIVYVTHDQAEAMVMSDRIVVMNTGKIEQIGTPKEVYEKPSNRFVANFIGLANFVRCRIADFQGSQATVELAKNYQVTVNADPKIEKDTEGLLMLRPERIEIKPASEVGIPAVVERQTYLGDSIDYIVELQGGNQIRVKTDSMVSDYLSGDAVTIQVKPGAYLMKDV